MAIKVLLQHLLLLALALQCSARSTPGDDYEEPFSMSQDYQTGLEFSHSPVFFDTDRWNTQSDQYFSTLNENDDTDPVQENVPFSEVQSNMFASRGDLSELPYADSAMSTSEEENIAGDELSGHRDVSYEDDSEVYFDTSDADTIYKAPDDE